MEERGGPVGGGDAGFSVEVERKEVVEGRVEDKAKQKPSLTLDPRGEGAKHAFRGGVKGQRGRGGERASSLPPQPLVHDPLPGATDGRWSATIGLFVCWCVPCRPFRLPAMFAECTGST